MNNHQRRLSRFVHVLYTLFRSREVELHHITAIALYPLFYGFFFPLSIFYYMSFRMGTYRLFLINQLEYVLDKPQSIVSHSNRIDCI